MQLPAMLSLIRMGEQATYKYIILRKNNLRSVADDCLYELEAAVVTQDPNQLLGSFIMGFDIGNFNQNKLRKIFSKQFTSGQWSRVLGTYLSVP